MYCIIGYVILYFNHIEIEDGCIWSWGNNDYGKLGIEDTRDRNVPNIVSQIKKKVELISVGYNHTMVLLGISSF